MPITLTIHISNPEVVCGDARTSLYNSVAPALEALGQNWHHVITQTDKGNLLIEFQMLRPNHYRSFPAIP